MPIISLYPAPRVTAPLKAAMPDTMSQFGSRMASENQSMRRDTMTLHAIVVHHSEVGRFERLLDPIANRAHATYATYQLQRSDFSGLQPNDVIVLHDSPESMKQVAIEMQSAAIESGKMVMGDAPWSEAHASHRVRLVNVPDDLRGAARSSARPLDLSQADEDRLAKAFEQARRVEFVYPRERNNSQVDLASTCLGLAHLKSAMKYFSSRGLPTHDDWL